MAKNLAFRIKVELVETDAEPSTERCPEEDAVGYFSLVLPESEELNISALDRAALDVGSVPDLLMELFRPGLQTHSDSQISQSPRRA